MKRNCQGNFFSAFKERERETRECKQLSNDDDEEIIHDRSFMLFLKGHSLDLGFY